jgi:hypothetical protein
VILVEPGVVNTEFVQDLIVLKNRYGVDKNGDYVNPPVHKDKWDALLSPYSNTIGKFLSFYYKAMSNAPHPAVVANGTILAIEKVSNGNNAFGVLYSPIQDFGNKQCRAEILIHASRVDDFISISYPFFVNLLWFLSANVYANFPHYLYSKRID